MAQVYDPEQLYDVTLGKVIKLGVVKMLPRDRHELTGAFIAAVIAEHGEDAIVSAVPK